MRCRSTAVLFAALAALCFATSVSAQGDLDCTRATFPTPADAQAVLDADLSDPNNLDFDGDGVPCESLFGGSEEGRPSSGLAVSADDLTGNVSELPATGSGPASSASMQSYAATLAAACSLVAVFAALMLTRHRSAAKPPQA